MLSKVMNFIAYGKNYIMPILIRWECTGLKQVDFEWIKKEPSNDKE